MRNLSSELEKAHASMFIEPSTSCDCKWCDAKRKNWAVEWPPEPPRIQELIDESTKLRKVVEVARGLQGEGCGAIEGCGCAICHIHIALCELDEDKQEIAR
jgi:hypothetical protein